MTRNLKSSQYTNNLLIPSLPGKELIMIPRHIQFFFGCFMLCLLLSFDARFVSQLPESYCPKNTIYNTSSTSGRVFRANLNFLLSTLTSNDSRPNGFYNFTAGSDPSNGTVVYGLFLCRGDATTTDCQVCVATASREILARCPDRNAATIWYDNCLLRFSNQSIFSRVDFSDELVLFSAQSVSTDTALFVQVLRKTLDQLSERAVNNDPSGRKFAVQEQGINSSTLPRRIFTLGQCTPDLSTTDCERCLGIAIGELPLDLLAARVIFPSCNIRYETYRFYNTLPPPSLPPPSSLPPPPSRAASGQDNGRGRMSTGTIAAIIASIFIAIVLLLGIFFFFFSRARRSRKEPNVVVEASGTSNISYKESLQYNLSKIRAFTNNFDLSNRIGEGGFGPVYKGTLPNGQEIAVKRLSRSSTQGKEEFINEIALVAKLQHRNLVRLLGYCLDEEERILIYEFVPNKSLDYFLFDPEKQALLDWSTRYKILGGIARGILYLHEDSRLRIIHRDLKASNVLLDRNMNPKIADFGMAKLFETDQIEGNTSKIAGTFGYMSPEYAMRGLFSVKSDVFSFGVLVLEIISGKKNRSFAQSHSEIDLLTYAWKQWRDGTPLALVDPSLGDSYVRNEVIPCIQIGLLCVQEDAEERPTMASVVVMLNNYSVTLPTPNSPAFYVKSKTNSVPKELLSESEKSSTTKSVPEFSRNEASITELYPR